MVDVMSGLGITCGGGGVIVPSVKPKTLYHTYME